MTNLSSSCQHHYFPIMMEDVCLEKQPQASLACQLQSPVGYITQKPSRYVSCSEGLNKICDDAFLAGHFCALIQTTLAPKSTVILNM